MFISITKTPALLIPEEGKAAELDERRKYTEELNKRIKDRKQTYYLFSSSTTAKEIAKKIDPKSQEHKNLKQYWIDIAKK